MPVTQRAPVQETVQGSENLVVVVAVGVAEVVELDQVVDFLLSQVKGDAAQPGSTPLARGSHPHSAWGDAWLGGSIDWWDYNSSRHRCATSER
jgi:hypothetical protein